MSEKNLMGQNKLEGIGGWLILVIIGLSLSSIMIIKSIISEITLCSGGALAVFNTKGSEYYNPGMAKIVIINLIINILIFLFILILLFLCFTKKKLFPKLMIVFYLANLILVIFYVFAANSILKTPLQASIQLSSLIPAVIPCFIWIPYFIYSERVKNTFVN